MLPGYQNITSHMIFDVKMGKKIRIKAQFFADVHKTKTLAAMTFQSVLSKDLVRIALKIAALKDLDVLACDIQNPYLTEDCIYWVWMVAVP